MSTLLPLSMESGLISFMKNGTVRSMPASIVAPQRSNKPITETTSGRHNRRDANHVVRDLTAFLRYAINGNTRS
jgi:hypothetical protein